MRKWRQNREEGNEGELTSVGILAHDAVHVLHVRFLKVARFLSKLKINFTLFQSAFNSLMQQRSSTLRTSLRYSNNNKRPSLACDMSADDRHKFWEHGQDIMRALKDVHMQGLSGNIRFDETGKRTNYSLDVVEMTSGSELVKIGKWGDYNGLEIKNTPMLHRYDTVNY